MRRAKLKEVKQALADGGYVRRFKSDGYTVMFHPDGLYLPLDDRTYNGFLRTVAPDLHSEEKHIKDETYIEWRKK